MVIWLSLMYRYFLVYDYVFSPFFKLHLTVFPSSMLSEADEDGVRHMVLCRVILGNIEKVEAGSQQSHPSSTEFDTGVDDPTCPKRYIVWCSNMNRHILPEYIVSFRSTYHLLGKHFF